MHPNVFNWLTLLRMPDLGPSAFKNFLKEDPLLNNLPDIAKTTLKSSQHLIKKDLAWAEQKDCHIMLLCDYDYPLLLKNIHNAPPVLFIKGNRKLLNNPQVAIVGSRKASPSGEQTAFNFAAELSKLHITTISGLAAGVDAAGHKGALSIDHGTTIAVLAHGLDIIYPKQHGKLADHIVSANGAIISEFPIGVPPFANHFPRRNRIISGLALGVVVIEASLKSGSIITATHALEQGRDVFAIPGSIYDQNFKGCHKLIKQGAKLVENVSEIVEDLGFLNNINNQEVTILKNKSLGTLQYTKTSDSLDNLQTKILDCISYEPTVTDVIINRSGLMPNIVNATLVNLELSGFIVAVPGGYTKVLMFD